MDVTQRRYLEGFFAGLNAREAGAMVGGSNGRHGSGSSDAGRSADPWRTLLACAEQDRPPAAGERGALTALGVVDLGPEGWDGCRLRLRASGGRLRAWQLRELAAVAQTAAGGFVELGERGGVELAVVGWREAAGALARLRGVGLVGGEGRVRCSPAAGVDAGEVVDVTALAGALDAALGEEGMRVGLDGGARGWDAAGATDDLCLSATGEAGFAVTAGGMRFGVAAASAASAMVTLAGMFRENGGWEGLDVEGMREAVGGSLPGVVEVSAGGVLSPGTFAQRQPGVHALVAAGPGDGLWRSRVLLALAGLTEEIGAGEARLWRGGVLVPGVAAGGAETGLARLAEIVTVVR